MVELKLLKSNNIITLEVPGKNVIKSSGGAFFHNSMELLCVALGSCVGKYVVRYCSQQKINVESFESIKVDMNNRDFIVYIQHPKTLTEEQLNDLEHVITNCDVGKMLLGDVKVEFSLNKVDPDLTRKKRTSCCGG